MTVPHSDIRERYSSKLPVQVQFPETGKIADPFKIRQPDQFSAILLGLPDNADLRNPQHINVQDFRIMDSENQLGIVSVVAFFLEQPDQFNQKQWMQ